LAFSINLRQIFSGIFFSSDDLQDERFVDFALEAIRAEQKTIFL